MKIFVLIIFAFATAHAESDIFTFKDVKGFEKCMNTDHLVEIEKGQTKESGRFLRQGEVQLRCIEKAVTLLGAQKPDKGVFLKFIQTTKRTSAHESALDLINVAVTKIVAECNNIELYEVLTKALSHPKDYPSPNDSYFDKTKDIVKICVKDKEFKTDFLEEKNSENSYLSANACEILKEEKLVKDCKKD